MKFTEWLQTFPMHRTQQGATPGKSAFFRLDVRVHREGFGFMTEPSHVNDPQPVSSEDQAVETFRALWRRALSEAQAGDGIDGSH